MPAFRPPVTATWSPTAMCLVPATVAQTVAMLIVAAAGQGAGWPLVGTAGAVATATIVLATRLRMPARARAIQIAALTAALLMLAASQDVFGLRAVDRAVADATRVDGGVAVVDPPASSGATLTGDTAEARAIAALLPPTLPTGEPITGRVIIEGEDADRVTVLSWSSGSAGRQRWCGTIRVTSTDPAAVAAQMRAAMAAGAHGARGCF